jgi:hypothetical protein
MENLSKSVRLALVGYTANSGHTAMVGLMADIRRRVGDADSMLRYQYRQL